MAAVMKRCATGLQAITVRSGRRDHDRGGEHPVTAQIPEGAAKFIADFGPSYDVGGDLGKDSSPGCYRVPPKPHDL